ncbi:hypothetical protein [Burkholderia stagnalis]|uniref:hypothetical protein n=1 Tax=Burkholderia stagnalis TaxID=1503054 RepID=UPI000F5B99E4|nr:hypothetical protein [Burkholderia stagnalis]RQP98893.1 hypothetical protein DF164_31305 [Burkholderia stagnalis]RQY64945.1 hypothetical protein DF110_30835 [Burkholderia stagnalis]
MTHYAIIEQYGIQKNGGQSEIYDKGVTGHVCVYKRTYRLGGEFDECIEEACAALSGVAKDLPKLLVISAHGHERSGDLEIPGQKDDGDEKSICLWQHASAFQPIPDQTVVHLSSCFGAYPNALAIQYAPDSAPPIIAPLVNINFDDATALHTALLNYMNERGIGDAGLREFVDQQQEVLSIHDTYCGRYVVGLIDRIGTQHPPGAVGQLAAEVERSRIIFVVESVDYSILSVELDSSSGRAKGFKYSPPGDVAKGFWLAVQSGGQHNRLRVPLGELGDFIESDEYEAMCGRKFCALYQVAGIYGNDVWAELLEVKEIDNRTNNS